MVDQEDGKKVTKVLFNNFLIQLRPKVKVAICFTVRKLKSSIKNLKNKHMIDENVKERKIRSFNEQIKALKSFDDLDVAKYVSLSQKSVDVVLNDISASADQKALTRVATYKILQEEVQKFRNEHPNWAEEVLNIIKSLGINYRKERLIKLKKDGRINKILKSDKKLLTVLNEVADLGVDKHLLQQMGTDSDVLRKKAKRGKVKLTLGEDKKGKGKVKQGEDVDEGGGDENEIEQDEDDDDEVEKEDDKEKSPMKISSMFKNIDSDGDEDNEEEEEIETNENKSKIIKQNEKSNKITSKKSNLESKNDKQNLKDVTKPKKSLSKPSKSQTVSETSSSEKVGNEVLKKESSKNAKEKKRKVKVTEESVEESENELEETEMVDSFGSEDENFLKSPSITGKKKVKKSSFFIGRMESADRDSGSDSDSPRNDQAKEKSEFKPILKKNLKRKDADDDSNYDDSKFFRSKMFRGDDSSGGKKSVRFGTRGESSDRGGSERGFRGGRSRSNSRGRGSGRGSQYGNQERRKSFSKDGEDGSFSERDGGNRGGFTDRGRGRGSRGGFGDRGRSMGNTGGFGDRGRGSRGGFGDRGRGSRGGFEDRGRGRGNRGGFEDRGRGRGNRGGFSDRGRGRGSRGGFGDRGRGKRNNSDFSGSSNFTPLGSRDSTSKKDSGRLLHPSWAAKKEQQGLNVSFQGKRKVFDE